MEEKKGPRVNKKQMEAFKWRLFHKKRRAEKIEKGDTEMNLSQAERNVIQKKVTKWDIPAYRVKANGDVTDKEGKTVGRVKSVMWKRWWGPKRDWLADVQFIHFRAAR